jgi:hypothetical protein
MLLIVALCNGKSTNKRSNGLKTWQNCIFFKTHFGLHTGTKSLIGQIQSRTTFVTTTVSRYLKNTVVCKKTVISLQAMYWLQGNKSILNKSLYNRTDIGRVPRYIFKQWSYSNQYLHHKLISTDKCAQNKPSYKHCHHNDLEIVWQLNILTVNYLCDEKDITRLTGSLGT